MQPTDEKQLIARILDGHAEEYGYFLTRYGEEVFCLVARLVPQQQDAEELVQDAFVRAYDKLDTYTGEATFRTWLCRIAYNLTISWLRKQKMKYVNIDEYDEINVMTDVGLVSGLAIGLGSQKKVVIMEDGTGDYLTRSYKNIFKNFFSLHAWKGFILSLLGYSNPGHYYPLRSTKNCIKYSSHP